MEIYAIRLFILLPYKNAISVAMLCCTKLALVLMMSFVGVTDAWAPFGAVPSVAARATNARDPFGAVPSVTCINQI